MSSASNGPGASVDALFLSPHLDDAVLSCGGQIHRRTAAGERVRVVTVFAGAPAGGPTRLGAELHALWGLPAAPSDAIAARRAEDGAALALLGAEKQHWDLVDAVYRGEPTTTGQIEAIYPTLRSLYAPPSLRTDEAELVAEIAKRLRALSRAELVFAPLGVGHHVDHVMLRRAAEQTFEGDGRLRWYEELPYARRLFAVARAREATPAPRRWSSEIVALDEADLDAKCRAVACYASQVRQMYRDEADLRQKVRADLRRGGERVWRHGGQGR